MELDPHTVARGRMAVQRALPLLLEDPNIGMVDFGLRDRGGTLTDELSVRCHVLKKFRTRASLEAAIGQGRTSVDLGAIREIAGFPVDVLEGHYKLSVWGRRRVASPRAARQSPMCGGISISAASLGGYGTLGGKVIDRASGAEMLLSNWHVLIGDWWPRPGRPIYQPGTGDGGGPADTIAAVVRDGMSAGVDAAVAELTGERPLLNHQLGIGPVMGVVTPRLGMIVVKSGRASDITTGLVSGIEGIQLMTYAGIERMIRHVVTIDPIDGVSEVSRPGDSGSFWIDRAGSRAVALHFAGSNFPERALGLDMQRVLDALGVDLAPAAEPPSVGLSRPIDEPALRRRPEPAPRRRPEPGPWSLWATTPLPQSAQTPEPHPSDEPRLSPHLVAAIERAGLLADHSFGEEEPGGNGHYAEEDRL